MLRTALIGAGLTAALAGCGATPLDYHPGTEIPRGPGLFSGEEGALVLQFERQRSSGSPEYREFQEWREWREWKRRQAQ